MRYHEIIAESNRTAPLYHFMRFEKALDVFTRDAMDARWEHLIPGIGKVRGNSFSRNKNFRIDDRPVRLVMSQERLSFDHKIIPLDGEIIFHHSRSRRIDSKFADRDINTKTGNQQLSEEFVIGNIEPLHRYISSIEVFLTFLSNVDAIHLHEVITSYSNTYDIPARFDPKFMQFIDDPMSI